MGKIKKQTKIRGLAFSLVLACLMTTTLCNKAMASDIYIPADVGANYSHDYNSIIDKGLEKEIMDDVKGYETRREYRNNPSSSNQVIKNYNPNGSLMQAQVEDIDKRGVYIDSVEVAPSQILSKEEVNKIIQPIVGKNVFMNDIVNVINEINNLYATKGFVTAKAFLPEQTVSNGKIYIELIESKIGNISVSENRWTKSKYITDRMPQKQNELFDIVELEQDILDFNRYNEGVNLTANLKAGATEGTTDIELTAHEKFPFHLVGIMDNQGRYTTGSLRGGAMIYTDSLFGVRDKLSIGSYFSGGAISPFFDYNVPVNKKDGRVGFLFSSTLSKIKYGPYDDLDLKSKAYQYSLYYTQPLVRKPGLELKSYLALNYKRSRSTVFDDAIHLGTDQITSVDAALNLRKDTKYGIWYLNQGVGYAIPILDRDSNYLKISGNAIRLHDFSHGVIGQLRGSYQVIPHNKHIPYLDQFQAGGMATVRGYSEGLMIGKNGYYLSGELMFPLLPREITGRNGEKHAFIGKYIKGAIFADHGAVFPTASEDYYDDSYFMTSIGMGLRVQLPGDLSARLYWGYPLINHSWEHDHKAGRFHFELTMEPNFDALLRNRTTAVAPRVEEKRVEAEYVNNYDDIRHYDYYSDGGGGSL